MFRANFASKNFNATQNTPKLLANFILTKGSHDEIASVSFFGWKIKQCVCASINSFREHLCTSNCYFLYHFRFTFTFTTCVKLLCLDTKFFWLYAQLYNFDLDKAEKSLARQQLFDCGTTCRSTRIYLFIFYDEP